MGQGAGPRYLWPREQVFQPPFVPCCVGRFAVRFVLAGIVDSSLRLLGAAVSEGHTKQEWRARIQRVKVA